LPRSARNDNIIKIEVVGCEAWPMKLWSSFASRPQRSRLRCEERSDVAISNILQLFVRSPRFARDGHINHKVLVFSLFLIEGVE